MTSNKKIRRENIYLLGKKYTLASEGLAFFQGEYKWLGDTAASSNKEDNSCFRKIASKLVQLDFTPQKITLLKRLTKKPS